MQNNQSRKLAYGAMMIALFTVLMAIVFYVPLVNLIAALVAPLPIIWYSAHYERKSSFLVAGIAVFVSFFYWRIAYTTSFTHFCCSRSGNW